MLKTCLIPLKKNFFGFFNIFGGGTLALLSPNASALENHLKKELGFGKQFGMCPMSERSDVKLHRIKNGNWKYFENMTTYSTPDMTPENNLKKEHGFRKQFGMCPVSEHFDVKLHRSKMVI